MKKVFMLFIVFVASLSFLGCGKSAKVQSYSGVVVSSSEVNIKDVEAAIFRAGVIRGWSMKKEPDQTITATYQHGQLVTIVSVIYTTQEYRIEYKDSNNMKYSSDKETISSRYIKWVRTLNKEIHNQLSALNKSIKAADVE